MPKLKLKCICPATSEEWNKTYPEKWTEDDETVLDLSEVVNIYTYDWGNQQGLRVDCADAWYFAVGLEVCTDTTKENQFKLSDITSNSISSQN